MQHRRDIDRLAASTMLAIRAWKRAELSLCAPGNIIRRSLSTHKHDPLRLLFCGADGFSIYSLKAVHKLQLQRPETIKSIDVVCRPDKRVGRGLKRVQEVPIKKVAQELGLPLHQIDTFTGWTPPAPIDLVVAVSFGLLVPSRILAGATYGGLNVHPSMLPDLRGPAPIQHALLRGRGHTGVSLQTMHPSKFDHGIVFAQTPHPGVVIPNHSTPEDMIRVLGPMGANLLAGAIHDGSFLVPKSLASVADQVCEHAPKIMPEDRHIDWSSWTADRLLRYDRVLGKLWDLTTYNACHSRRGPKRITFNGPWREVPVNSLKSLPGGHLATGGHPALSLVEGQAHPHFAITTIDGRAVSPETATIEGEQKGKALPGLVDVLKKSASH